MGTRILVAPITGIVGAGTTSSKSALNVIIFDFSLSVRFLIYFSAFITD
jgi:hypothetical protein